jgi:hypothetical protein
MGLSRLLDEIGVRNMWLYRRPPVESTPDDAARLLDSPYDELHVPASAPTLTRIAERDLGGCLEEHFTFPSQRPSGHATVDTAHVIRFSPGNAPGAGRHALVLMHGAYAASFHKPLLFVPEVTSAPWDTVCLELPHHLRRQRPDSAYSGAFMVTADVVRITHAILQADCDIRALVLGLRALGYERIVIGGISIGASPTMQALVGIEVDGAFGIVPSVDAYVGLWASLLGDCLRPVGRAAGFTDALACDVLSIITPRMMGAPRIDPHRILLAYGLHDLVCVPKESRQLSTAWNGCHLRELPAGHASVILSYPRIRRLVFTWAVHCFS